MPRLGRERILIGGESKTGKTFSWMKMVKHLPQAKFVCVEPDDGVTKIAEEQGVQIIRPPLQPQPGKVFLFPVMMDWPTAYSQVEQIEKWANANIIGGNDWVITEGLDIIVDVMAGEYAERTADIITGGSATKGLAPSSWNAFIEKRRKKAPILEGSDYQAIYTEFRKALNYFAYQMPCHWMATAGVEQVRSGQYTDDQDTKEFYASMGMPVKVSGYKRVPRMVDSLVLAGRSLSRGFTFQVYADRGQKVSPGQTPPVLVNNDFYLDFLQKGGFGQVVVPPPMI